MSLRTLATADAHVKTAVTVGMTSATRTVSAAALHNGPLMSALLRDLCPTGLGVLAEPAGGAVLVDGEPCRHLAMVLRDKPRLRPGERALPVAEQCPVFRRQAPMRRAREQRPADICRG